MPGPDQDPIAAFLAARLDDTAKLAQAYLDRAAARGTDRETWAYHLLLRDVEADRQLLARYERGISGDLPEWNAGRELITAGLAILLGVIRLRAAVYCDHPDFKPEWAP